MTWTVLAVDDDPDAVALYRRYLADEYHVREAATGREALDATEGPVDVVLLDRRLPDLDGRTVLERLRERDRNLRVAMVTAVEPDFDVVDMPFDDYLVKPVARDELRATVARLTARLRYSDLLAEHYRVASTIATLEAAKTDDELASSEEFADLQAKAADLRDDVVATLDEIDDYETAFSEASRLHEAPHGG